MSDPLTERIIGAAIEVHRILGPGLLESIYEDALCIELDLRGIPYERQKSVDVSYKGHRLKGKRLDLVVAGEVVLELKAVNHIPDITEATVLSYLHASGLKRALIINFNRKRLVDGVQRISL